MECPFSILWQNWERTGLPGDDVMELGEEPGLMLFMLRTRPFTATRLMHFLLLMCEL